MSETAARRRTQIALEEALRALATNGDSLEVLELLSAASAHLRASTGGPSLAFRSGAEAAAETTEAPDFIWQPFLASGAILELAAKIKVGKTRFLLELERRDPSREARFVGFTTQRAAVLYLTEERAPTFRVAMDRVGLTGREGFHVLYRHEYAGDWSTIAAGRDRLRSPDRRAGRGHSGYSERLGVAARRLERTTQAPLCRRCAPCRRWALPAWP